MSDIWSVGDSDGASAGKREASGDWDVSSCSSEEERPRKRAKKSVATLRPAIPTLGSNRSYAEADLHDDDDDDDDDDLLAGFLTGSTPTSKPDKQPQKGKKRNSSPFLADIDLDDLGASTAGQVQAACSASPDPVRLAAIQQRALHEKLAQAQHAGEDDSDVGDDVEVLDSDDDDDQPLLVGGDPNRCNATEAALHLLDEWDASQPESAAAAAPDSDKLELVFQAQGHDKVTVRVQKQQPLSHAMAIFTKYAADQGWGSVTKFLFDGDRLKAEDTPDDLGMETEDAIDVYISG